MSIFHKEERTAFEVVRDLNRCAIEQKRFKVKGNDLNELANHINYLTDEVTRLRFYSSLKK